MTLIFPVTNNTKIMTVNYAVINWQEVLIYAHVHPA